MRRSGWLMLTCISLVATACGKKRVEADVEPWLPATEANGFHAVEVADHLAPCTKRPAPLETRASEKTTLGAARNVKALVADERYVYFIDTQENQQAIDGRMPMPIAGATIERLERSSGGRRRIALTEGIAQDIAVPKNAEGIYWSTVGGGDAPAIWSWSSRTERVTAIAHDVAGRLVGGDDFVAWTTTQTDGMGEVRGYTTAPKTLATIPDLVGGVLATDGTTVFAASRSAIWSISAGGAARKLAATETAAEDIAVDRDSVWWIERGVAREYCAPDGTAPAHNRYEGAPHPSGTLKRAKVRGGHGDVEVVATDLADVHKLTVRRGIAWIATPRGVVRVLPHLKPTIDPLRSTVRLAPVDEGLFGAAFAMGQQEITLLRAP